MRYTTFLCLLSFLIGVFLVPEVAIADQLFVASSCKFVVAVPGIFGSSHLHFTVAANTVFNKNSNGRYCGSDSESTPFGTTAKGDDCYKFAGHRLVSGSYGDKIEDSTCVFTNPTADQVPFSASTLAAYDGSGKATVTGQAFLRQVGGRVVTCAGSAVFLMPATSYVRDIVRMKEIGIKVGMNPSVIALTRNAICDAQGKFSFDMVPTGRWYLSTSVTWGVPHIDEDPGLGPSVTTDQQGGKLRMLVSLKPGMNSYILTGRDEVE